MKALSLILGCNGLRRSLASARLIRVFKPPITRTKRSGERGLPWCNPLAWQIRLSGEPFRMNFVLAEDRISEIKSIHLLERPRCCRRPCKKRQFTMSKAFLFVGLSPNLRHRRDWAQLWHELGRNPWMTLHSYFFEWYPEGRASTPKLYSNGVISHKSMASFLRKMRQNPNALLILVKLG